MPATPQSSAGTNAHPPAAGRVDLQAALEQSEAFYSSLVESLPQNILRKDLSGRFTFANSRVCRTLGVTPAAIIGKTDFDFFPADLAAKYQADDRAVIQLGQQYETVEAHASPTGKTYVRVIKTPIRDRQGRAVGIQCIFWDVTDEKRLGEQLHFERELLQSLLTTSPDAIYFKDLESRFLRVSASVAAGFGLASADDAVGKTDADFFLCAHADEALADEREIIRTGQPIVARMERETRPDTEDRWVMTTKMPFRGPDGEIRGTLGISRDVTELKRAEDALAVARDAALESARLKAEFLANMSHEIRTPLNAVVGMAGLLLDTKLDADQHEFASTVRTSAEVLLGIVNDILDFSKIEAGKMTIEHIDFDLGQLVEEAADLVAGTAQSKGLELAVSIPAHLPAGVAGDPSRIRQVLVNLLGNAVKFTERGEVVVAVDTVAETPPGLTLRFQVRDTGIGIPAEAQARLFSAFTQADGSTTRRYGGTGLGLAICRRLVDLMGGEIGIDSAVGRGSTFWFTVPLERRAAAPQPVEPGSLEHLRVLIVDDNETNRAILHRQVLSWRMRDGCAASGAEALAALREAAAAGDPYRLVVLDLHMPEMDGIMVARAIKEAPELGAPTVAMLTSLACHPEDGSLQEVGISAYLTKPVKQSRLYDCLATLVGQRTSPRVIARKDRDDTAAALIAAGSRSLRVLVAEDNPVNQKVVLRLLKRFDVTADAVGNGIEVIAAVARVPYDIILMDCQMPEMDGYEATRGVRQLETGGKVARRPYVIAVTANALDGDRDQCLRAGMDDYVSKPIRLEELAEALLRGMAARPAAAPAIAS